MSRSSLVGLVALVLACTPLLAPVGPRLDASNGGSATASASAADGTAGTLATSTRRLLAPLLLPSLYRFRHLPVERVC
jgi:hypothetical protein